MNNLSNLETSSKVDVMDVYKMKFIYNALENGWSVRKLNNNNFEFSNQEEHTKKEFYLDNFLKKFIHSNLNINHIINQSE